MNFSPKHYFAQAHAFLALVLLAGVFGAVSAATYSDLLQVGPLNEAPAYFYINTKIPFTDSPAPQLHITGYNYAHPNKAVKLTLGWYVYQNTFWWTQYKSDIGYYNPSRIRLGTYDDNGTKRIRIEIANDGTYWASYAVTATDHNGVLSNYQGWTYALGELPAGTTDTIAVPEYTGFTYSNAGNVGIGTAAPGSTRLRVVSGSGEVFKADDGASAYIRTTLGIGTVFETGNVGIGTANPAVKLVVASQQTGASNTVVGEFTKDGGISGYGSTIVRLSRGVGSESADIEFNSGGGGPFRYGTYADGLIVNNQNYTHGPYGSIHFVTNQAVRMTIGGGTLAGNVGIGTTSPTHKLSVNGAIRAKEVIVDTGWADYVFADDYRLAPLSEVEAHIKTAKHLPGIPSAAEVAERGVSMGEMQAKLLAKIEELTLHQIAQEKRIEKLETENVALKEQNARFQQRLSANP